MCGTCGAISSLSVGVREALKISPGAASAPVCVLVVPLDLCVPMFLPCQSSVRQEVRTATFQLSTQGGGQRACFSTHCISSGTKGE